MKQVSMEYDIIRSARKTLSVTVKDGRVIVKAPNKVSERKIAEFVERHKLWIFRRIQEQEGRYRPNFSDGSSIELFGNTVKIETGKAALTSEKLFLPNENREEALKKLLKSLTRDFMTAMTAAIADGAHATSKERSPIRSDRRFCRRNLPFIWPRMSYATQST